MVNFVIKKDGSRIAFESGKVKNSVMAAAAEAGLSNDEASDLAEKVLDKVLVSFGSQEEVATSEIKGKALSELDSTAPSVSESWRKYDESHGK